MTDDLIARGKAIADSGKHQPRTPPPGGWTDDDFVENVRRRHAKKAADQPPPPAPTAAPTISDQYQQRVWRYIQGITDRMATIGHGERNTDQNTGAYRAFRLALGAGIHLDDVEPLIFDAQVSNGQLSDDGANQVRGTMRSARQSAQRDGPEYLEHRHPSQEPPPDVDDHHAGEWDQPEPGDDTDTAEAAIADRMHWLRINREARRRLDDEENPPPELPPVRSLDTLLATPPPPIHYRVDQLAPIGGRVMLSAQWKAGKTTLIENLIRALVDETPFLGRFDVNEPARSIVVIDAELSENMLHRWLTEQNITNTGAVADVISLRGRLGAFNILDDKSRARWATRLADLGCDYLVLDPLRPCLDALGLDENRDAGKYLTAFDALLAEAGISDAAIAHHMGHNGEHARGDSRLEDWPDAIWRILRADPKDPTSARHFSAAGRDVAVPEGRLAYDPASRRLTYAPGSRKDTKTEAAKIAVVELLAAIAKDDPHAGTDDAQHLSMSQIEGELSGAAGQGHPRDAVRDALMFGVMRGFLTRIDGARCAKLHRIAKPCTECGKPLTGQQEGRHLSCAQAQVCHEWSL
jgi:hypothetical protein